jgi:8-oxo-dGTP pyrophosphatase MutT (NUDIX family)
MGAGFLPVSLKDGKLYFLFGEERQRPGETARGWADFGGGPEKNETNIETASREGSEELTGLLGNYNKIKKMIKKKNFQIKVKDIKYTSFLVPIEYSDDIVNHFNNQTVFFKKYITSKVLNKSVIYEKSKVKWYSLSDMKNDRNKFREFFRNIIDEILLKESEIMKLFTSPNKKTRKNRND